jgi:hypothetical protein
MHFKMKKNPVNLKLIYITAHSVGLVATQIKSVEVRLVFRTTTSCYSESTRSRECYPRESQMLYIIRVKRQLCIVVFSALSVLSGNIHCCFYLD